MRKSKAFSSLAWGVGFASLRFLGKFFKSNCIIYLGLTVSDGVASSYLPPRYFAKNFSAIA